MSVAKGTQLVIFGLTGDLARKKLIPALYRLLADGLMPDRVQIVGVSRQDRTAAEVLAFMRDDPAYDSKYLDRLQAMTHMAKIDLTNAPDYVKLRKTLDRLETQMGICANRLFYLSMPPQVLAPVITQIGASKLNRGCPHGVGESRALIEKPFGYDLPSAEELVGLVSNVFREEQVYRIDHYVAKETSQNILTFRFRNPLFQSVWHGRAVDRIIISAAEKIGVEGRAVFYDQTGALRDLLQSHLLQLLALITMEEPKMLDARHIHEEKLRLLQSVVEPEPDEVAENALRGQYIGYREEVGKPSTATETFAALRLRIDNDRWRGVPVLLESGKALNDKVTEITLVFKDRLTQHAIDNALKIRIQPDEGICLGIMVKKPGFEHKTELANMDFRYSRSFEERHPDAYERVLKDAIRGDRTLFSTSEEVLESWRIVQPVLDAWARDDRGLVAYKPGTPPAKLSALLK